jgi:hypothetical protein
MIIQIIIIVGMFIPTQYNEAQCENLIHTNEVKFIRYCDVNKVNKNIMKAKR